MGKEVEAARDPLSEALSISDSVIEIARGIAGKFGLAHTHALDRLLDLLIGYSCRDQTEGITAEELSDRRAKTRELAISMKNEAANMLQSLGKIYKAILSFNEICAFNPAILEAVFEVDTGDPDNLFLPPEIDILQSFFPQIYLGDPDVIEHIIEEQDKSEVDVELADQGADPLEQALYFRYIWEEVDNRLSALATIPLRPKTTRGPMPNVLLQRALILIKQFWTIHAERAWAMSNLKIQSVRKSNNPLNLKGKCELFVVAVLSVSGIPCTLPELHNAWTAIDGKH